MNKNIFCLLLSLAVVLFVQNVCLANGVSSQVSSVSHKNITFIYINGSNDYKGKNRLNFKEHFTRQVNYMHPYMIKYFYNDKLIYSHLLKNGKIKINKEPVIFYWGDKSINEVQSIDSDLDILKAFTPKFSQMVRSTFAHCLHDAVWVQKYQNMSVLIDELHEVVKKEILKGNDVVLLGYSAGSFITYEYFLNKFISINPSELANPAPNSVAMDLIKSSNVEKTCLDALLEADIVRLDLYGRYTRTRNMQTLQTQFPKLNEYSASTCIASESVKGVINFASPLSLFYSDITDTNSDINFLSKLMYKHILETDMFWLTVNYREDPLGFPVSKNLSRKQIDMLTGSKVVPQGGFVYDKSNVKSGRTFISAHLAYWDTQRRFVKGIVEAYNEGYENLYNYVLKDDSEPESL